MIFVSFVVATFNCEDRVPVLARTIEAFAGFPCEFIVADGGSKDKTVAAAVSAGAKVVCSDPDRGIYDAWGRALPHCRGIYISFIGVDDVPIRSFYEKALTYSKDRGEAVLLYGDSALSYLDRFRLLRSPECTRIMGDQGIVFDFPHPGALNHRSLFLEQSFDPTYRLAGDLAFYVAVRQKLRGATVKIEALQAVIEATGLSRQPAAAVIYKNEYKRIESEYQVRLGYWRTVPFKILLARIPLALRILRALSWLLRGRRTLPV